MAEPRRFPPPWTIEELNNACFVVSDANGQKPISLSCAGLGADRMMITELLGMLEC